MDKIFDFLAGFVLLMYINKAFCRSVNARLVFWEAEGVGYNGLGQKDDKRSCAL